MKVTHETLQSYFAKPLPTVAEIADAFTFHCFEIEEVAGNMLDIKVLPNRAADCNTEQGIAYELASILDIPLAKEPALDYSKAPSVSISLSRINNTLGSTFSDAEVTDVFRRLRFEVQKDGENFTVKAPAPRTDIQIPEDVVEEVGRILSYERVPATQLPPAKDAPDQNRYRGIERMKDQLVEQGFTEVSTQSFTKKGDVYLANPLDTAKPALRTSLEENLNDALTKAKAYAPLVLAPNEKPKLFEVGSVFPKSGEYMELRMTETAWEGVPTHDNLTIAKLEDYGKEYAPKRYQSGPYKPFSIYPFVTRDIALWVPGGTEGTVVANVLSKNAGELLVRLDQFDRFEKDGKISYAFRLAFVAMDRTLTDADVNPAMEQVTNAVVKEGWQVR